MEKTKIKTEQWEWLIDKLKMVSYLLKSRSYISEQDIEDITADVLENLARKPEKAKYIAETQNTAYLVKMFKARTQHYVVLEDFDTDKHTDNWFRIKKVCDTYNIEPVPQNAYKIETFINDKRLTIAVIENILKEKRKNIRYCEELAESKKENGENDYG